MDHRSYESWLLEDEHLTPEQDRELRQHLRNCAQCAALAHANRTLRAAPMSVPAKGFTVRFQARLAAERKAQRIRSTAGLSLILVVGVSVALVLAPLYETYLSSTPTQLAAIWITNLMLAGSALRAIGPSGNLLAAATVLVPPYVWALSFALFAGVAALRIFSSRRFTRYLQARGHSEAATSGDQR